MCVKITHIKHVQYLSLFQNQTEMINYHLDRYELDVEPKLVITPSMNFNGLSYYLSHVYLNLFGSQIPNIRLIENFDKSDTTIRELVHFNNYSDKQEFSKMSLCADMKSRYDKFNQLPTSSTPDNQLTVEHLDSLKVNEIMKIYDSKCGVYSTLTSEQPFEKVTIIEQYKETKYVTQLWFNGEGVLEKLRFSASVENDFLGVMFHNLVVSLTHVSQEVVNFTHVAELNRTQYEMIKSINHRR